MCRPRAIFARRAPTKTRKRLGQCEPACALTSNRTVTSHLQPRRACARLPFESGTASYDLKKQARCIVALEGDTDHNTFLVASLALRGENEVHVIEFNEDTNEVWCPLVYSHPHEVWNCASCPAPDHAELLLTTHSNGAEQRTTLWRMDGLAEREAAPEAPHRAAPRPRPMTELLHLGGGAELGDSRGVLWNTVLPDQVQLPSTSTP